MQDHRQLLSTSPPSDQYFQGLHHCHSRDVEFLLDFFDITKPPNLITLQRRNDAIEEEWQWRL